MFGKSAPAGALTVACALLLISGAARAAPILQLYVEGSTYNTEHESWVFTPSNGEPIRLWVIGNVDGPGGMGTIVDVKLSVVYEDPGSPVSISLTPGTTEGYGGVADPSIPGDANYIQTVTDGSAPLLGDGSALPSHGVYHEGAVWQEFGLGDFDLTDSPIADFMGSFPDGFTAEAGQINVYEMTVEGALTDLHIDVYNHVMAGNHVKYTFAPLSHDAGTGVNDPFPVPEPGALGLFLVGLMSLAGLMWRRGTCRSVER